MNLIVVGFRSSRSFVPCEPPGKSGLSDPHVRALEVFTPTFIAHELIYKVGLLVITYERRLVVFSEKA